MARVVVSNEVLGLTISGMRGVLHIGKNVIRTLNNPEYLCFRVSKNRESIIIFPCEYSDPMSYRVPEGILSDHHKMMRVCSKAFVRDALLANHLDVNSTYTVYGRYYARQNLVCFNLKEAFENRMDFNS